MRLFPVALALIGAVTANHIRLDSGNNRQICEGMYAKKDWGGSKVPHIGINLAELGKSKFDPKYPKMAPIDGTKVSYVIFEYRDLDKLGVLDPNTGRRKYVCDETAITDGLCTEDQYSEFLVGEEAANTTIQAAQLTHMGPANITYHVLQTGYYCVSTFSLSDNPHYKGYVNFQNAFGHLSASEIPKLPAYGILTLCYAVTLALYGFQFFKKRDQNQILPLQRYLLAMLAFLTFDTLVVWSYYDLLNRTPGPTWFVSFYVVFLSLLSSVKITFCLFLLLCIALGYGVVTLKLSKKKMLRCKILAGAHFTASMVYLIGTYHMDTTNSTMASGGMDDTTNVSFWDVAPVIPVIVTLTAFYVTILASIRETTANLHKQRQVIKLQLYENLFRIISAAVMLTLAGLVLSGFFLASVSTLDMVESNWKGSYFIVDFWPSVTFFGIFLGVSWLWRPTETSYMLAVSQQLSTGEGEEGEEGSGYQHGHEFELDDVSLMSHSDDENGQRDSFELSHQPPSEPPKYNGLDDVDVDEPATSTNNTLFELGDDVEEDGKKSSESADASDNRLK